jgi:hypothetical protein
MAIPNSKKESTSPIKETAYINLPKSSGPKTLVVRIKKINQSGFTTLLESSSQKVLFCSEFLMAI